MKNRIFLRHMKKVYQNYLCNKYIFSIYSFYNIHNKQVRAVIHFVNNLNNNKMGSKFVFFKFPQKKT